MTEQQSSSTNKEEFLQSSSLSLPFIPCVMGTLSSSSTSGDDDNEHLNDNNRKVPTITLEGIVYDSSMVMINMKNNKSKSSADSDMSSSNDNDGHNTISTSTSNRQQQQQPNQEQTNPDENVIATATNNNSKQPWFVSSLFSSIVRNSFGASSTTATSTSVTTTRRRRRRAAIDDPSQHQSPSCSTTMTPVGDDNSTEEERDSKVERNKNFVQHDEDEANDSDNDCSILDRCDNASHRVASRSVADQSVLISRSFEDTTFLLEDGLGCGTRMFSSSFDMSDLTRSHIPPPRPPRRHVSEGPSTRGASSSQNNDCLTSSITFPFQTNKNKTTPSRRPCDDCMKANTRNNNNVIGILSSFDTTGTNALQQQQQKLDDRTSTHDDDDDEIVQSFDHNKNSTSTSPSSTAINTNARIHHHRNENMGNACMVCPPSDGNNNDDDDDDEDHYYHRQQGNKHRAVLPLHQQVSIVPLNDTYYNKQRSFGRINSHGTFEETISPSDSMTSLGFLEKQKHQQQRPPQQQKKTTTTTTRDDRSSSSSFVKDVVVAPKEQQQQPQQLQNNSSSRSTNNTTNSSSDNQKGLQIVEVPSTAKASPPRGMIRKFVRKMSSLSLPSLAVTATAPKSDSKHQHRHKAVSEAERLKQLKISRVKHLLRAYGCTTAEEHVDKVDDLLTLCKDKKGWQGLTVLGFGYRMIHHPHHCTCAHSDEQERSEDCHLKPFLNMYDEHCRILAAAAAAANDTTMSTKPTTEEGDDDDSSLSSADDDDVDVDNAGSNAGHHNAASTNGAEIFETIKSIRIASHAALNNNADNHLPSFSAPSSSAGPGSINGLSSVGLDYLGTGSGTGTVTPGSLSVRSGFSFCTNRTELELKERLDQMVEDLAVVNPPSSCSASSSTTTNASKDSGVIHNKEKPPSPTNNISSKQQHCLTRLVYLPTSTIITEQNRHDYIADGTMYEEVARLTQEASQECMVAAGNLEWITICDDTTQGEPIRALVDVAKEDDENDNDAPTTDSTPPTTKKKQKTLLIVTGKGKVRAGIFSRKHLLTTGMEPSTALPLVYEARQRHLRIVILDPNARGDRFGMQTFEQSLNHLFEKCHISSSNLYVLAHSAAGAQLVRFLKDKHVVTTSNSEHSENDTQDNNNQNNVNKQQSIGIDAIAFTDSTHNVQWTKHNPALHQALVDETTSIYLKSAHQYSEEHEYCSIEMAGHDVQDLDDHWKHRFGNIPTKWAGTQLHELTNWTGRHCIWHHFDQKLNNKTDEKDNNNIRRNT